MTDEEIIAHFDGRGRVHLRFGRYVSTAQASRMAEIAYALGYRPLPTGTFRSDDVPRFYERDDSPQARRRAEQTIVRLHAGGPVQPPIREVPPPHPGQAPPLMPRQRPSRSQQSRGPQPSPPAAPPMPGIPPMPWIPPRPLIPPPPSPQAPTSDN